LGEAVNYAQEIQAHSAQRMPFAAKIVSSLAFLGGCLASAAFFFPWLWSRGWWLMGLPVALLIAWGLYLTGTIGPFLLVVKGTPRWDIILQAGLLATAGLGVLILAIADLWTERDARSLLLFLWVAGTFVFAGFVNWAINARSILPAAPAVGILVARQLSRREAASGTAPRYGVLLTLLASGALALWTAAADYKLADSARTAAQVISRESAASPGRLWFEGHWGFQYYMQEHGLEILDIDRVHLEPGDTVAVPLNNYALFDLPPGTAEPLPSLRLPIPSWLATMNPLRGAGFYLHRIGPLPFTLGPVPEEEYQRFRITRPITGRLLVGEAKTGG
jgi:hypothetical protein